MLLLRNKFVHLQEKQKTFMQYAIYAPKHLGNTIKLPASKSISNRALILHALSGGHSLPQNLSDCDDTEVIVRALRN